MTRRYPNKSIARKTKVRAKLKRFSDRPRLSVFRSNKYIYSQIIDDKKGETLVSASEKDLKSVGAQRAAPAKSRGAVPAPGINKVDKACQVGGILAKKALKKKIKQVYFDRGKHKYHGRVEALAKGAREGGLIF